MKSLTNHINEVLVKQNIKKDNEISQYILIIPRLDFYQYLQEEYSERCIDGRFHNRDIFYLTMEEYNKIGRRNLYSKQEDLFDWPSNYSNIEEFKKDWESNKISEDDLEQIN